MSAKPTNLNELIQRLNDEGYSAKHENECVIVSGIPYIDADMNVHHDGVMYDSFPKKDHTTYFSALPHTMDGKEFLVAGKPEQWNGYPTKAYLSFKKTDGKSQLEYSDEHEKWVYYLGLFELHAKSIDPSATAKHFKPTDTFDIVESPFVYEDSNSSRAGINHVSNKLSLQKIAIVGLGGTGAYILDLVSKTRVSEIHLYDDDKFHTHNAFRTPGATPKVILDQPILKVKYLEGIYSKMHKGIKMHEHRVSSSTVEESFSDYDFVFVSIDASEEKKHILNKLIEIGIPFVDCGLSVEEHEGSLIATIRATTFTSSKNDHLTDRVHCEYSEDDLYGSNIQIAELNAFNATLAVMKWKRVCGFYHNHETEHHAVFMTNCNSLSNDEKI